MAKSWLRVRDVQERLNLSKTQAYNLVNSPSFPKIRIGGAIRIEPEKFEQFLKKNLYKKVDVA